MLVGNLVVTGIVFVLFLQYRLAQQISNPTDDEQWKSNIGEIFGLEDDNNSLVKNETVNGSENISSLEPPLISYDPEADKLLDALNNNYESSIVKLSNETDIIKSQNISNLSLSTPDSEQNCSNLNGTKYRLNIVLDHEWNNEFLDNISFGYKEFSKILREMINFVYNDDKTFDYFEFINFNQTNNMKIAASFMIHFLLKDLHLNTLIKELHSKHLGVFNVISSETKCESINDLCEKWCSESECRNNECNESCCKNSTSSPKNIDIPSTGSNSTKSSISPSETRFSGWFNSTKVLQNVLLNVVNMGSKTPPTGTFNEIYSGQNMYQIENNLISKSRSNSYRIYTPNSNTKRFNIPSYRHGNKHKRKHRKTKSRIPLELLGRYSNSPKMSANGAYHQPELQYQSYLVPY